MPERGARIVKNIEKGEFNIEQQKKYSQLVLNINVNAFFR